MKTILSAFLAALICFNAFSQASYSLQTVVLGTNVIPAVSSIALPLALSSVTVTNPGMTAIWYWATNSATNTVIFSLPSAVTNSFTNTYIESNWVYGISTNNWTVYEPVSATNSTAYYVTNAAYVVYTNGVPKQTNAAVVTTNIQSFPLKTPVNFTVIGTNYSTVITTNFGAGAVDVRQSATVGMKVSFNLMGSGTSNVVFTYKPSLDPIIDTATAAQTFIIAANGTSTVSSNLSISPGVFGYLVFTNIFNYNGTAVTNLVWKYAQKIQSP